jgi:endogenous inhibitor of DNA gyrase (YacG/DUF329 family)
MNESSKKHLKCAICKKPVEMDRSKNPFIPFCCERCRTIDLGKWLNGDYVIEGESHTSVEGDEQ